MGKKASAAFQPLADVAGTYDPELRTHVPLAGGDRSREVAVDHHFVAPKPEGGEKKPLAFVFDRAAIRNMIEGKFRPVAAFDIVTYKAEGVPDQQADFCLMLAFNTVRPGGTFIVPPDLARARKFSGMQAEPVGDLVQITKPK